MRFCCRGDAVSRPQAHYGITYLRYDDTNPEKEEERFLRGIREMVEWLGEGRGQMAKSRVEAGVGCVPGDCVSTYLYAVRHGNVCVCVCAHTANNVWCITSNFSSMWSGNEKGKD